MVAGLCLILNLMSPLVSFPVQLTISGLYYLLCYQRVKSFLINYPSYSQEGLCYSELFHPLTSVHHCLYFIFSSEKEKNCWGLVF